MRFLLLVSETGHAKRLAVADIPVTKRLRDAVARSESRRSRPRSSWVAIVPQTPPELRVSGRVGGDVRRVAAA